MSINISEETIRALQTTEVKYRTMLPFCKTEEERRELKIKIREIQEEINAYLVTVNYL